MSLSIRSSKLKPTTNDVTVTTPIVIFIGLCNKKSI